jgi:hypothetical protein
MSDSEFIEPKFTACADRELAEQVGCGCIWAWWELFDHGNELGITVRWRDGTDTATSLQLNRDHARHNDRPIPAEFANGVFDLRMTKYGNSAAFA